MYLIQQSAGGQTEEIEVSLCFPVGLSARAPVVQGSMALSC